MIPITEVNPGIATSIEKEVRSGYGTGLFIKMTGPKLTDKTAVLSTTTIFKYCQSFLLKNINYIINLHRINDILKLDDFN